LFAQREQGTKTTEQFGDVMIGGKERADELVSPFGDSLASIFRSSCHLDIGTRPRHCISSSIDTLDCFTMDGVCGSVSKPVSSESEHMMTAEPSIT
jgi:hypothetical protein